VVLGETFPRSGSQCLTGRFIRFVRKQPEQARGRVNHANLANRADSICTRKIEVYQSDVRLVLDKALDCLVSKCGFCYYLHVRFKIDQQAQTFTQH